MSRGYSVNGNNQQKRSHKINVRDLFWSSRFQQHLPVDGQLEKVVGAFMKHVPNKEMTCLLLLLCIVPTEPSLQAAPPSSLVYEKTLLDGDRISVVKERMPPIPDVLKFLTELKARSSANARINLPDYSEAYTYSIKTGGQPQKIVWLQQLNHFPGQEIGEIKVLDAACEADALVVALKLKAPAVVYAAVIRTGVPPQNSSFRDHVLTTDSDALGVHATSAKINGSLLKGTLSVEVTLVSGKHDQFSWKEGKWIEDNLPPFPSQSPAIRKSVVKSAGVK